MLKKPVVIALAAGFGALFGLQPYKPVVVLGNSMAPALKTYQLKLASRNLGGLNRGDIVVFNHNGNQYVKRVALLEGDEVTAYYFGAQWNIPTDESFRRLYIKRNAPTRVIRIRKGEVYVMGDNLNASVDSRTFGPIRLDSIVARLLDSDGPVRVLAGSRYNCRATPKRTAHVRMS